VTHPERGVMILDRLAEELAEVGVVEQRPLQDGRNMTMMLGPSKAVLSGELAADEPGHDKASDNGAMTADGDAPATDAATTTASAGSEPAAKAASAAAASAADLKPATKPAPAADSKSAPHASEASQATALPEDDPAQI